MRDLVGGEWQQRLAVIPNWIDCTQYSERTSSSEIVNFVFLGWCEIRKGIRELVQAAQCLKTQGVPFRLHIAGGGSRLGWLRRTVVELGIDDVVVVHGWVAGVSKKRLLMTGDVLVLPSYTEGMPNAVLEGMASGMAVIATPVGGLTSLIDPGVNGFLVPSQDCSALSAAMRTLAEDSALVRKMGRESARRVRECHDISVIWPSMTALLGL